MRRTCEASVTVAAAMLQKAGLIAYSRGRVKVKNRSALERAACECYGILKRQQNAWNKEVL